MSRNRSSSGQSHHDVFLGVADPTRREIVKLLLAGERSIASITQNFEMSRTAVIKHLQILSDAGLVKRRRQGRETRFTLDTSPLSQLRDWLSFFDKYWDERLSSLRKYVEEEKQD